MKCVFISHSSKDANVAKALCHQLEEAGVRCWMAPRDITPGVPWSGQIADAIREASVFVLVFSQHSNKSDEVLNELGVANKHDVPILPLRIEAIEPSGGVEYYVGARHWLDAMTPPLQEHVSKLVEAIQKIIALEPGSGQAAPAATPAPVSHPQPQAPAQPGRKLPVAWIATAVLAVIVGVLAVMMAMQRDGTKLTHRGLTDDNIARVSSDSSETATSKAPRKAFVVGVNDYRELGMPPLKNAMNDARLVRQTLEKCGFTVDLVTNVSRTQLLSDLTRFSNDLRPGDDAVFYFSGQGLEEGRDLFLLTTEFKARTRHDLHANGVHLNSILQALASNEGGLKLVILDCCRTVPFPSGYQDKDHAPAVELPRRPDLRSLMVLYAAGVAKDAYDSGGDNPDNSPFAQALCKAMLQPGWTLEDMARDTASSTARQTQGLQRPEVGENNLTTPYRLVSGPALKE